MPEPTVRTNQITGVVLHKETRRPLEDLLVVAYDLDPNGFNPDDDFIRVNPDPESPLNNPATFRALSQHQLPNGVPGDRLGSVLTDENGRFRIEYDDAAFKIRTKKAASPNRDVDVRPDLFLIVLAAEQSGLEEFDNVLFRCNWARINAGRHETYLIEIGTAELENNGLEPPTGPQTSDDVTAKVLAAKNQLQGERSFRTGMARVHDEIDEADREEKEGVRALIKRAVISDVSKFTAGNPLVRFVADDETIEEAQKEIYSKGADRINQVIENPNPVPGEGIKINVFLSSEEMAELDAFRFQHEGDDFFNIPESKIQEILFKREDDGGINAIVFSDNPISKFCLERSSAEKCAMDFTSDSTPRPDPDDDDDDSGDTDTTMTSEDIPALVDRVLESKRHSLFDDNGELSTRPDAASVQASVDAFALQKGPADATAFYDFDMLQIAFDHVWKQLVDETLVNLGEQAHFGLQNNGRKSFVPAFATSAVLTKPGLAQAVWDAFYVSDPIPSIVLKNFDVSLLEYEALSNHQKSELVAIAKEIDKLKKNEPVVKTSIFGIDQIQYVDHSDRIESLHEQGEMILENVRINKPNSTNAILKDLHERLQSKYEFTVFAADNDAHSVNFGLLNTYRQKWEPIAYQAGKLAKTIPMAPKEERKYSVKVTRRLNTTEKQAQKANSAIDSESNLTTRAESEIVSKAQKKSDFDFSVSASYGSVSSKLGIGKDASKDSSETKKAFREAVLKAAQEYKDEWSLQVETEESFDSESTQSGTVTNPNDELSVTYLFYQLQRRYRVSEQLHRTMPVVLVAMDVPAPHEITEGWVIAHDWILNRVLLDDSFRNALEAVTQRTVGDDFALRELRKNLREQRRLVRSLEREFAKLQRDVENKYRILREAVGERIEEEHDKRFFKRRLWLHLFGSGNAPEVPDPEMAKALEQAAEDDHLHAVEQAKQLSMSVQREVNALHEITREYNRVMEEHLDRKVAVKRLLTHVKENIFYYMQAIWSMEPPDQRFMRLYKVKVPSFEAERTCIISASESEDVFAEFRKDGKKKHEAWLHGSIQKDANGQPDVSYRSLVEVCDLDAVLGFKGNYMIFPLKKHNALTELMSAPYVDEAFGAMDPDQLSNITLEEFSKYICCLHQEDPERFQELKVVLREWLSQLLSDPLRNGDEVIVPTDSLFIEMLPSDKSLLEDFKLRHRQMDVMKVRAEIRQMELENLRYAARLLTHDHDDPEVDKKVVIHGNSSVIVGDQ